MTDDTTTSTAIDTIAKRLCSLPNVLLPSEFIIPRVDIATAIASRTQALAGSLPGLRFDIAEAFRSQFFDAQLHLAETLRSRIASLRFEALLDIKSITHGIAETLRGYEREMSLALVDVALLMEQADRVTSAGWIPHPALPIKELVGCETDTSKIAHIVECFVQDDEEVICEALAGRFSSYTLPQGTLALCDAVLRAHQLRLFPLIVPAVFAEIERCARVALGVDSKPRGKWIIDNFVARINDLPVSDFNIVQFPTLMLIETVIYKSLPPDPDASFLNRHGSQHGLVRFDTKGIV